MGSQMMSAALKKGAYRPDILGISPVGNTILRVFWMFCCTVVPVVGMPTVALMCMGTRGGPSQAKHYDNKQHNY